MTWWLWLNVAHDGYCGRKVLGLSQTEALYLPGPTSTSVTNSWRWQSSVVDGKDFIQNPIGLHCNSSIGAFHKLYSHRCHQPYSVSWSYGSNVKTSLLQPSPSAELSCLRHQSSQPLIFPNTWVRAVLPGTEYGPSRTWKGLAFFRTLDP